MGEVNARAQLLEVVRQVRRRWRIKLALRGAVGFLLAGLVAIVAIAYTLEALKFSPDAIFWFRIVTVVVFVAAGLGKETMLLLPGFSADQDVIGPVGQAMAGLFNTAHWSPDFDNAANKKFVAEFRKAYKRTPTLYASQGYDDAQLIDATVRAVKGNLQDKDALRRAMRTAKFDSVRGPFKFNTNQYPIQNYYVRTVGSDGKGGLINKSFNEPILRDHGDAYVQSCKMPK